MLAAILALIVYSTMIIPLFVVVVVFIVREVYTPARVRGESYAMRKAPIPGRHEDKRKDVEGDSHFIVDNDGNDPTPQTIAGGAGQIAPLDLSAYFDNILYCKAETFDAVGRTKWVRNLAEKTLLHGTVTNGPYAIGDSWTTPSGGSGTITAVGAGFVQVVVSGGTALVGETLDVAAGSKSATLLGRGFPTPAAGDDAILDVRRFLQLEFVGEDGVAIGNGAAPDFGYECYGEPLFSIQGPNGPGPVP